MKITKIAIILFVAASLVFLICSTAGIAVNAEDSEETYTYEIPLLNISHGASSAMLFAVDAPIEDAEAGEVIVTYSYYVGAEQKRATAKYSSELTVDAKLGMPVFYTVGISPKDQGEEIVVEAHKADAPEGFEPVKHSTSVAKFLYSKLYRDGLIYSKEANAQRLARMYFAQIEYVSTCQDALWNAENVGAERKLLNTYNYVYVADGEIVESGNAHDLIAGDTVTVAYTGTDSSHVGWKVTTFDASGNANTSFVYGDTIALSDSSVITPCFDLDVITFEEFNDGDSLERDSENKVSYVQNGTQRIWGGGTGSTAIIKQGRDGDKGMLPTGFMWLYPKNYEAADHNVSLLELDFDCEKLVAGKSEKFYFRTGNGTTEQFILEWRYYDSKEGVRFRITDEVDFSKDISWISMGLDKDDTSPRFKLKIEYLWSTGSLRISVDNNVILSTCISASATPIFRINYEVNINNTVILDNIRQTTIYADPTGFASR